MFKSTIIALMLALQGLVSPTIEWKADAKQFVVKHERGAIWSCTVFRMVVPTETNSDVWPDGHYAPRSCGPVNPHGTSFIEEWSPYIRDPKTGELYNVEWDVWAEVQYPVANKTDEFLDTVTNKVRVRW